MSSLISRIFGTRSRNKNNKNNEYTSLKDLIGENKKSFKKRTNSSNPKTKILKREEYTINEEYVPEDFSVRLSDNAKYPGLKLKIVRKTTNDNIALGIKKKTRRHQKKYKTRRHKNLKNTKKRKERN